MIVGVFDLFHRGHVEFFKSAAEHGNGIVVVVNGDHMVSNYKRKPIYSEQDRLAIIKSLRWVDDAVISNSFDIKPLVERFRPSVIVHGDDWPRASYLAQIRMTEQDLQDLGVELMFIPYYADISTSGLIQRIKEQSVA